MKQLRALLFTIVLVLSIFVSGCSSANPAKDGTSPLTSPGSSDSADKTFTVDELKKYNGQDGTPAYVAVDGVVYDVSSVRQWRNGSHQGMHTAGTDLTDVMKDSPHGKTVLKSLPVVGKMA